MKTITFLFSLILLISCNVSVDKKNDKDSTAVFDSTLEKVDDRLERWGDSAKEKFKDAKQEVKDRFRDDSTERGNR